MEDNEKKRHEKKHDYKHKLKKYSIPIIIILASLLLISIAYSVSLSINQAGSGQEAANNVKVLLDKYLASSPSEIQSVKEMSGIYNIQIVLNGEQINIYSTKDGKYLILPGYGLIPFTSFEQMLSQNGETEATEIPKTDKPKVELFVMSFCPYGVHAENAIIPVVKSLGNKIDFKIKFIASVQGNTIEQVNSLHGINEAKEDARQLCILKHYSSKYLDYLNEFNANCYADSQNPESLEKCWKDTAKKFNIDVGKIEKCAYGTEGINLLKENEQDANNYGVGGSPTLMINSVQYNGARTSEAYQESICSAFTSSPAECSTKLSSSASAVQGNC